MAKFSGGRLGFREWIDQTSDPGWTLMPLTHITKGIGAEDIIRSGAINPTEDSFFDEPLAYLFYGRPAYRVSGDGTIKVEAACPFCFIFDGALIKNAKAIHAFDTGAFEKRMYKHILLEEMNVEDFSLERDSSRPNRLISRVFSSMEAYFEGDTQNAIDAQKGAEPWEFHARAYLQLLTSPGRNEPDDRICSIEVVIGEPVPLEGHLKAVIVPHTLWTENGRAPWLQRIATNRVEVVPYIFVPGKHPDHYRALLETAVRELYRNWGVLVS